ncbi:MAG: T9SS C-terminal target domain-containing protein, partial [Flavobacteriia bacterium]|nr:T9SS C-terminal target domain-containing protein [Flavobacteriia bacterium]
GKLLISQTSTSGNENLDISSLSEGIYWVNLVTDKGNVQPIKVIVSR